MKLFGLILSLTLLVTTPTFKLNDNNDNGLNELFHYKMNNLNGFEEISKTTNVSISGTQHLITDENGNQNEAVKFNGDGGYKFNQTPNLPSDYVIDINVKPYSSITDLGLIISKADYKSNDNRDFTLGVGKEGSKYYIILNVFNDTLGTWSAISDYITIDTYHNVRVEFVGTFAQMFVDNKSLGTVDVKPRSTKVTPFIIGYGINSKNNTNTSYQAFKGEISDLKILEGLPRFMFLKEAEKPLFYIEYFKRRYGDTDKVIRNLQLLPEKIYSFELTEEKKFNIIRLIDRVNGEVSRLEEFPIELLSSDTEITEELGKYEYNICRSLFGINNPKIISVLLYMNNVLSKYDETLDFPNITLDPGVVLSNTPVRLNTHKNKL